MAEARKEGTIAKTIEEQTSKIPSDVFLWGGIAALAAAGTLVCAGRKHTGLAIGQWAAPLLIMGLYNKLVKVEGHDKDDDGEE
jgi:hypothetical protein